ncbi:hypothetical protein JRO89_XSUnG0053900 [Xanthoceras sorbifolium]|uniref:Uncharacterized protein n=1 Tax=Xanthoceras sorbifolium TaxID=99658 RepID=A0ABQ8GZV3_9ROSI|nr:hypothetical protein JRO89_XSUnG0053900 [Xanthoceras sorbifolium]
MGCISSKLVSRSLSFQEDLNKSLHRRRANGSGNFLALISSANSVPNQILSTSFASESNKCSNPTVELVRNETSDTWELKASLEQGEQVQPTSPVLQKDIESIEVDLARRLKSFRCFDDCEVSSMAPESFDGIKEYRFKQTNGGRTHARGFHTVQEFDAIVEKICLSRAGQTGLGGKNGSLQLHHSKSSSDLSEHAAQKLYQELEQSRVEENTGLKRKAMANELESLRIPQSIEFPEVADLREWLSRGQVYSPGTYVTPKFGSYNLPKSGLANKCSEGTIFDPELVAALEECMEQLEVEEEIVLKQIEENFKEENTQKKQN